MATWRSTAETSVKALSKALKWLCFSAKNREQYMKSPIGDPRISKLGRMEDFTVSGKWEFAILAEHFTFGMIDVKP